MGKGRAPCCDKSQVKKGPWSPAEDLRLITFIQKNGHDNWRSLPKQAGLSRCGKSCRLRWINYLRPDLKRGNFTAQEEDTIIKLHDALGNKWSKIASYFPGRTDNEIKNVWNTHLKKRALDCNRDTENYEYDQSKESSVTSSSTSSLSMASSHNLGEKRRAESELVMNDDDDEHDQRDGSLHIHKKPRESCRDVTEESDQSIKDMSRTSSFSSNYSSSVTNSGQVDHHDATTVRSEEDDQILDSFFEFSTDPYGFGMNTLGEVNKPENVPDGNNNNNDDISRIEIPLEADFDFWDLLDGVDAPIFQSDLIQCLEDGFLHINNNEEDVDNRKWFQYLENELGLESTEDQNQEKKSTKEPEPEPDQPFITAAQKPTFDPGMINFQPWPPSPPPPPTPVL